jgi:hypothetical protein
MAEVKIVISAEPGQAIAATSEISKAFTTLKSRSVAEIEAQKSATIQAYEAIKNSGVAAAVEIQHAEYAKNKILEDLNKELGVQPTLLSKIKEHWLALSAAGVGAWMAINKAMDYVKLGVAAMQAEESYKNVTAAYGEDADKLLNKMKQVSAGIISESALMQRAVKALQQGLSGEQIVSLLEVARSSARVAGIDIGAAFDRITEATANQMTKGLQMLGIVIDQNKAYEEYARKIGVAKESLTEMKQSQALANAAIEEGQRQMQAMGEITMDASEKIQKAEAQLIDLKETLGKGLLAAINAAGGALYWLAGGTMVAASGFMKLGAGILYAALRFDEAKGLSKDANIMFQAAGETAAKGMEMWKGIPKIFEESTVKVKEFAKAQQQTAEEARLAININKAAFNSLSEVISTLGIEKLTVASDQFSTTLNKQVKDITTYMTDLDRQQKNFISGVKTYFDEQNNSLEAMKISLGDYIHQIDSIYNKQIGLEKSLLDVMKKNRAEKNAISAQTIAISNIEKAQANATLSAWKNYYQSLISLHDNAVEKMKAKSQELAESQDRLKNTEINTQNLIASIKQKSMTADEVYYDKIRSLENQEYRASQLSGDKKIEMLKEIQSSWSSMGDEVKVGEKVVVSAYDAQRTAMNKIHNIGNDIYWAEKDRNKMIEEQGQTYASYAEKLAAAMEAAKTQIADLESRLILIDNQIAKEKNLNINTAQATAKIQKLINLWDSWIPTTKTATVEGFIKSSPAVPFSEGIKNMTEALNNLPQSMQFTIDTSSLAGLIDQYKVLGTLMAATLGSYQLGPETVLARTTATASITSIEQSQKLIKNLFNVGMVQAFAGVYAQLEGHEKIDKQLEGLITRYLSNISSFQGLTSPIEFQKPSFIQVHPGETLYPANDNRNYSKNIVNNTIHIHDTGGKSGRAWARELDEELADMWRTGRSKLKRVMQ